MLNRIYLLLGAAVLVTYGAVDLFGWEFGHPPRRQIPADVRHSPGAYRSFWYSGYRGGK